MFTILDEREVDALLVLLVRVSVVSSKDVSDKQEGVQEILMDLY
jgi:hypothetical protein